MAPSVVRPNVCAVGRNTARSARASPDARAFGTQRTEPLKTESKVTEASIRATRACSREASLPGARSKFGPRHRLPSSDVADAVDGAAEQGSAPEEPVGSTGPGSTFSHIALVPRSTRQDVVPTHPVLRGTTHHTQLCGNPRTIAGHEGGRRAALGPSARRVHQASPTNSTTKAPPEISPLVPSYPESARLPQQVGGTRTVQRPCVLPQAKHTSGSQDTVLPLGR